eukprot:scaffold11032_cov122-Cylindrotheca_fusiformis.AAC.5
MSHCFRGLLLLRRCTNTAPNGFTSRHFGALTHTSWAKCSSNAQSATAIGKAASGVESPRPAAEVWLEDLFSQRLSLPHLMIPERKPGHEIFFKSTSLRPSILDREEDIELIQAMNRNARRPKKANRGSRPCSRVQRRKRKEAIGKRRR